MTIRRRRRRRSSAFIYLFTSLIKSDWKGNPVRFQRNTYSSDDALRFPPACKRLRPEAGGGGAYCPAFPSRRDGSKRCGGGSWWMRFADALGGQTQEETTDKPAGHDDVPLYEICGLPGQKPDSEPQHLRPVRVCSTRGRRWVTDKETTCREAFFRTQTEM